MKVFVSREGKQLFRMRVKKKSKGIKLPAMSNENVSKTTCKPQRNLSLFNLEKAVAQVFYVLK